MQIRINYKEVVSNQSTNLGSVTMVVIDPWQGIVIRGHPTRIPAAAVMGSALPVEPDESDESDESALILECLPTERSADSYPSAKVQGSNSASYPLSGTDVTRKFGPFTAPKGR
jgi:hypothetical protein